MLATDTMYYTHRGPMRKVDGSWISMRWTAHEKSREPDIFLSLAYTTNANQWLDAMRDYVAPTQNGLVADRSGNIAIRSSGMYPTRPGDGRGDIIRNGWQAASDWTAPASLGMLSIRVAASGNWPRRLFSRPWRTRASRPATSTDWSATATTT